MISAFFRILSFPGFVSENLKDTKLWALAKSASAYLGKVLPIGKNKNACFDPDIWRMGNADSGSSSIFPEKCDGSGVWCWPILPFGLQV